MSSHTGQLIIPIAAALLSLAAQRQSFAGSATWSANPASGDWNTATNWTANTVPNGPADIATFGASNVTNLSSNIVVNLDSIVFNTGAASFTITSGAGTNIIFAGRGIINNSGVVQSFVKIPNGAIFFFNDASAGELTRCASVGGAIYFDDSSSAASASIDVSNGSDVGEVSFFASSTAANSTITASNEANVFFFDTATGADAVITATSGGDIVFGTDSTAGNVIFTGSSSGFLGFTQFATADHGHFTANGAVTSSDSGAIINFYDDSSAGEATIIVNGGTASGAAGAAMSVVGRANAGNATITVNGGSGGGDGGSLVFAGTALGNAAAISVFDNGELDIGGRAAPGVTIGSLAGNGRVSLGTNKLTIGSNNQSTTFSGVIQDSGFLGKTGTGTLTLSEASTYTGVTTVSAGVFRVTNKTGSATGTGPLSVTAGTLGGKGIIAGATTIGTGSGAGAFLAPSVGSNKLTTLTIRSALTFKIDGTYTYKLNTKKAQADQVVVNGVTIQNGAQFNFSAAANKKLTAGMIFTAINNTAATPISGTFANLPDGSTFTAGRNTFQVSYAGGDGNDLTLTVTR